MPSQFRKLTGMPNSSVVWPRPVDGSQPRNTENTMIIIRPTQNVGRLKPKIEPAMIVLLYHALGFMPATRPSGMPSTIAISIAHSCLLYTSDAADERSSVDLGGRRI